MSTDTESPGPSFASCIAELAALFGVDTDGLTQEPSSARVFADQLRRPLRECTSLPDEAFAPLMAAAVHYPDPSFCRWFADPAVRLFGRRRVLMTLVEYLRTGTDAERYGAMRACYWAGARLADPAAASLRDAFEAWTEATLTLFAETSDLRMRRALLRYLPATRDYYPDRLHTLFDDMLTIAPTLPDPTFHNWVKAAAAGAEH